MTQAGPRPSPGQHLRTLSHEGRFWDVYLEFEDSGRHTDHFRGLLAFVPIDQGEDAQPIRTISVLIETSYEGVLERARMLKAHQLEGFLRSLLP